MDVWRLIAERKIEEAMAEGAFQDLSGAGAPLHLDEDAFVDPDLRMAHRLLKNNGFAPGWIEEARELESDLASLRSELPRARSEHELETLRRRAAELNRRIASFNLKTPVALSQKLPLNFEREISGQDSE